MYCLLFVGYTNAKGNLLFVIKSGLERKPKLYGNEIFKVIKDKREKYLKEEDELRLRSVGPPTREEIFSSFPYIDNIVFQKIATSINWQKLSMRFLCLIISSIWFSVFPVYLFVIYMYEKGFFSYEFFVDGVVGLKSFFFAAAIVTVLLSFYLFGFILVAKNIYVDYVKTGAFSWAARFALWASFALAAFIHYLLFFLSLSYDDLVVYKANVVMAFVIILYVSSFIIVRKSESATNWIPSAAFLFVSFSLPLFSMDSVAKVIDAGLRKFNVGADKEVKIYEGSNNNLIASGKVLFWSPDFIYFTSQDGENNYLHAYPTKNGTHIVVER